MKWTEEDYRRAIRRAKEEMSDNEVFLSERYRHLCAKMAKQLTSGRLNEVCMQAEDGGGAAGRYDGKCIYINVLNPVTQSFPTKELKGRSLVGILGHECGHVNYSSIPLRRKYLQGIAVQHKLYPAFPQAGSRTEKESRARMEEELSAGRPAVLRITLETAAFLHNLLEDVYIEEKMCARFQGSIRQGICMNRARDLECCRSVNAMVQRGAGKTQVMLSILAQYIQSGSVNSWDGMEEPFEKCLKSCKPVMDKAVKADNGEERITATNRLLLKLWPFIQADADQLEEQRKALLPESKEDGGSRGIPALEEKQENLLKGLREALSAYSPDYRAGTDAEASESLQEMPWEELKAAVMTEPVSRINGGPVPSGERDSDEKAEQVPDGERNSDEEAVRTTARELTRVIVLLAKAKVDAARETELLDRLKKLRESLDLGEQHKKVQMNIRREREVSQEAITKYKDEEPRIRSVMERLRTRLEPFLEKKASGFEKGFYLGKRLDTRSLYRRDQKIFMRRGMPGQQNNAALAVLVDQSGSMFDASQSGIRRIDLAKLVASCLYEFGMATGIPVAVYGHNTSLTGRERAETVNLYSHAEFDSVDGKDKYRIMEMESRGANRDGAALGFVGGMLLERPEKKKFLILISDGLPSAEGYGGEEAKKDLQEAVREFRKKDILFLAAAIGEDREQIREIYGNAFLDISDVGKLPETLTKKVMAKLTKEEEHG